MKKPKINSIAFLGGRGTLLPAETVKRLLMQKGIKIVDSPKVETTKTPTNED